MKWSEIPTEQGAIVPAGRVNLFAVDVLTNRKMVTKLEDDLSAGRASKRTKELVEAQTAQALGQYILQNPDKVIVARVTQTTRPAANTDGTVFETRSIIYEMEDAFKRPISEDHQP